MGWFRFDGDAYDADTMHLTPAEDGIYGRLLRFYYKTRMALPDNDRALAAIARISEADWMAVRDTIRAFFKPRRGRLHHKRCDAELDREDSLSRMRSERAQTAARKRHGKSAFSVLRAQPEQGPSNDTVMLGDATRPEQRREKKEDSANALSEKDAARQLAADFDEWWEHVPRKLGKGQAERAYRAARKKTDHVTLLAGIDRYAAAMLGKDPQFIKHPATWLNGACWLDEHNLLPLGDSPNGNRQQAPAEQPSRVLEGVLRLHRERGEPGVGERPAGDGDPVLPAVQSRG